MIMTTSMDLSDLRRAAAAHAVLVLWRRELSAIVRLLALQGVLLGGLAGVLAVRLESVELGVVAAGVLVLKAGVLPACLRRVLRDSGEARETEPLVNVTASLARGGRADPARVRRRRPLVATGTVGRRRTRCRSGWRWC